ncbi:MAG: phage major capsid protein, partial [Sarcina sp.]
PNPVQATQRLLFGKYPIIKVSNKTLPTAANKAPLYCGDIKEMVTIFDRESLSIEFNDIGYKYWNSDKIGMKVRERLDIKPVDVKAVIRAEIDISKAPAKSK